MTEHRLIPAIRTPVGWKADCACGFRTGHRWGSATAAERRVLMHIRLCRARPPEPARQPITVEQAVAGFFDRLYWALDESVPATRGGWLR